MKWFLSPKELAEAIGVSESSLKRWADDGVIAVTRTAGGHRRIRREEAIRFIRQTKAPLVRPELLGCEDVSELRTSMACGEDGGDLLYAALMVGGAAGVSGLISAPFLAGRSSATIFDGPICAVMHRVGELWTHSDDGVFHEHRATEMCIQAVMRLRLSLPTPPEGAPTAVGAAGPGDPYRLPTLMAATVLREAGFVDVNLGPDTPLDVLLTAARRHDARLAWLSISVADLGEALYDDLLELAANLAELGTALVLGGRGIEGLADLLHPNLNLMENMVEVLAFAKGLLAGKYGPKPV